MRRESVKRWLGAMAVVALCACADNGTTGRDGGQPDLGAGDGMVQNDAALLAAARAINEGEILVGNLAIAQAMAENVRGFAQEMVNDHTERNQRLAELAGQKGLVIQETDQSRQLTQEAMNQQQMLSQLTGAACDRAYIEGQINMHRSALMLLDNTLLPQVRDQDVRTYLQELRQAVSDHLDQATEIRAGLPT